MRSFLNSQIWNILMSWIMLFLFIYLRGELLSTSYKIFVGVYFWIPGFIALFLEKKEKLRLPVFQKGPHKLLWVFCLAATCFFLSVFFTLPFCDIRSVEDLKVYLPASLHSLSHLKMRLFFILFWGATGLFLVPTVYLFTFLGQELMFSGYAWEKLKTLGFWRASWIVGLYRGIWAAPLVLMGLVYPGEPLLGIFWMVLLSVFMAPLKIYLRIVSKAILSPALFLSCFLHFTTLFFYLFKINSYLLFGMSGLAGFIGLLFINLILFLKTRKTPLLEYEL